MANGWQTGSVPGWTPMPPAQSGLLKAGTVLLLVGAILSAALAAFVIMVALSFGVLFSGLAGQGFGAVLGIFYGAFGILLGAGAACGFVAWRKASDGDLQGAFVWGLVASLLPPVQVLLLLGAIFAKTCPEAEAATAQQRQGWAQPPQAR